MTNNYRVNIFRCCSHVKVNKCESSRDWFIILVCRLSFCLCN